MENDAKVLHKLSTISLSNSDQVSDIGISSLLKAQSSLTSLSLCSLPNLTGEAIEPRSLEHLNELIIVECKGVSGRGFQSMSLGLNGLRSLSISYNDHFSDHVIHMIAPNLTNLTYLKCSDCNLLTSEGVRIIYETMAELREFNMYNCAGVTGENVMRFGHKHASQKLTTLRLWDCESITSKGLSELVSSNLTSLTLFDLPSIGEVSFTLPKSLIDLSIERCPSLFDNAFNSILNSGLTNLTSLSVNSMSQLTGEKCLFLHQNYYSKSDFLILKNRFLFY
jgi:hypothetical protein